MKILDKNSDSFKCLKCKFPKLSDAKLKEGIFIGLQTGKLCMINVQDSRTLHGNLLNSYFKGIWVIKIREL